MKQTKEDKEIPDCFDEFNTRELLLNYRRALEKAKTMAVSANNRSQDAAQDVRSMEAAMVNYLDKTDRAIAQMNQVINQLNTYLALPWYKKLFYKGPKNVRK